MTQRERKEERYTAMIKFILKVAITLIVSLVIGIIFHVHIKNLNTRPSIMEGFSSNLLGAQDPSFTIKDGLENGRPVTYIYLGKHIVSPYEYEQINTYLRSAPPNEKIIIYLNGFGGRMDGGFRLINAIDASKAKIIMRVDGNVYSMHALLACVGDKLEVGEGAYLMYHVYSGGMSGNEKGSEALEFHKASIGEMQEFLTRRCNFLLTKDEIQSIIKGVDIYINSREANKRIRERNGIEYVD